MEKSFYRAVKSNPKSGNHFTRLQNRIRKRETILQGCKAESQIGKRLKLLEGDSRNGEGENSLAGRLSLFQHATERDAHAKALHDQFVIGRDEARLAGHFRERNGIDLVAVETNHPAELPVCDQL